MPKYHGCKALTLIDVKSASYYLAFAKAEHPMQLCQKGDIEKLLRVFNA